MTGMLRRLLRGIQLGGRTADEGSCGAQQDGPGEVPPDPPRARPLISCPNVRTTLAAGLLGCIAGAVVTTFWAPWMVIVLPFVLVGGILLLALDQERR